MEWLKALVSFGWRCACAFMRLLQAARNISWLFDRWNDHNMH